MSLGLYFERILVRESAMYCLGWMLLGDYGILIIGSLSSVKIILHRHYQRPISMVILESVKLTTLSLFHEASLLFITYIIMIAFVI